MKKLLVLFLLLAFVCPVLAAHYGSTYYEKNFQYQGGNIKDNPVYLALKEIDGSPTASGRGFSPAIWDNCPVLRLQNDPQAGFIYFNDFKDGVTVAANSTAAVAAALGTTGAGVTACTAATAGTTISMSSTDANGVVVLATTTDNQDVILSVLGGNNTAGMVSFVSGKKLWMECRVSRTTIVDSNMNLFVGFAEEGLVATTTFWSTSDALADKDWVGFGSVITDGDKLDTMYNTASASGVPANVTADAVTMAADTFTKLGIYFDGTTINFYQDGVLITDTTPLTVTTAGFPDGEEMAFYIAIMNAGGEDTSAKIDWVRIAAEI